MTHRLPRHQRALSSAIWLAFLGMILCPPAHAAAFDCTQARTVVEKLICGDEELLELDSQLNTAYEKARALLDDAGKQKLTVEQRRWLVNDRNGCRNLACLHQSYDRRLNTLDPFFDAMLTCKEMREHPALIFTYEVDLGSGSGSPNDVEYECPESLYTQGFMKKLLDLAERIRSEDGPQECTGSIISASHRYYLFDLAKAGFSPRHLRTGPTAELAGMDWNSFANDQGSADAKVFRYFRQWSEASPVNRALYVQFATEYERILPLLVRHYERHPGPVPADPMIAAKSLVTRVLERAAGAVSSGSLQSESPLVNHVREGRFVPADAGRPEFDYSREDIYRALVAALIQRQPLATIEALAGKLDLADSALHVEGTESLLAFAGDVATLEYLLRQKYPVDVANDFGKTALFYAIGESRHDAVRLLLRHGADVNHAYKSAQELHAGSDACYYWALEHTRRTPLMHAAQNSDLAMVRLLVEARADLHATDDPAFNALDYAARAKNTHVVAYLKSLGLEYGAPMYSSAPDPNVGELGFVATVPVEGFVAELRIAPARPDLLVATVSQATRVAVAGKPGVYLLSVTDPDSITVLSVIRDIQADNLVLSPDGMRAYVIGAENVGSTTDKRFGAGVLDISNPRAPRLMYRIAGDFMAMHLSADGRTLFLQERQMKPGFSRGLLVYDVGADRADLKCRDPFVSPSWRTRPIRGYEFASLPGEPLLLIHGDLSNLLLFDIRSPCAPTLLYETQDAPKGSGLYAGPARTFIIASQNGLERFQIDASLKRIGRYDGMFFDFSANPTSNLVVAAPSAAREVAVFKAGDTGLVLTQRIRTRMEHIGALLVTGSGQVYAGGEGSIGVAQARMQ